MQRARATLLMILILLAQSAVALGDQEHRSPPPEQMYRFPEQVVELSDFQAEGWILAVGGGGESVIGQLKGDRVVAIDISHRELQEAPGDALKIVMDARELQFLDGTFDVAASFFTLMYIDGEDHRTVFDEVYRVLRPGGRFLIWDTAFGERPDDKIRYGVIPLRIKLPDREIRTGYGARWPNEKHDLLYFRRIALESGFELVREETAGVWFHLAAIKPAK